MAKFLIFIILLHIPLCFSAELHRYRILKTTPYYENSYGINTLESCEPLTGEKSDTQKYAAGCLYPTKEVFSKEANTVQNVPTFVECTKIEYIVNAAGEFKFCKFDGNKRIPLSIIEGGRDTNGLPLCNIDDPLERCQFFMSEEVGGARATLSPQTITEACSDCSVAVKKVEPSTPEPAHSVSQVASDIARAAASQPEILNNNCTPVMDIPTSNPDRYFYNLNREHSDSNCAYNRYSRLKGLIEAAEASTGIHRNLLMCLMHRESRNIVYKYDSKGNVVKERNRYGNLVPVVDYIKDWDFSASSDTGAIGIGQFTDGTYMDISNRILGRSEYSSMWSSYAEKIYRDRRHEIPDQIDENLNDYNIVHKGKCDSRCDPNISAGISAIYLKYIMESYGNSYETASSTAAEYDKQLRILNAFKRQKKIRLLNLKEQYDMSKVQEKVVRAREYMVYISGAYNRGPGTIPETFTRGSGALEWQRDLVRRNGGQNSELSLHMRAIRNCMQALEEE